MGSGSHRGERDGRCYTGEAVLGRGIGGAPTGVHLSRGKQPVWGPGSRTTSGCQGQEGSWDTPLRSSPNSCPKPNNVTPQDAPIPLRAKPQCSSQATRSPRGHRVPPGHQILPGHGPLSLLCPRPARSLSRHFSRAAPSLFGHFLTRDWGPGDRREQPRQEQPCRPHSCSLSKSSYCWKEKKVRKGDSPRTGSDRHCQPCGTHWHQPWCWRLLPGRGGWE